MYVQERRNRGGGHQTRRERGYIFVCHERAPAGGDVATIGADEVVAGFVS